MILRSSVVKRAEVLQKLIVSFAQQLDEEHSEVRGRLLQDSQQDQKLERIANSSLIPNCVPYKKQLLVTPGNGSIATIESVCYQLLTEPEELYVIPSSRDQIGRMFLDRLISEGWELSYFKGVQHSSRTQKVKLEEARSFNPDLAILYGSDVTCALFESYLSVHTRIVKYGSKTSIGVHQLTSLSPTLIFEYTRDFFSFGGVGCLNTSVLYLLSDFEVDLKDFRPWIRSLAKTRDTFGVVPSSSSITRLQVQMIKSGVDFYQERGIFLRDTTTYPGAIGRGNGTAVIVVCSTREMLKEWEQRRHMLSSATVFSPGIKREDTTEKLFDLGVSRITIPGNAQSPSFKWKHDGLPLVPVWGREVGFDV